MSDFDAGAASIALPCAVLVRGIAIAGCRVPLAKRKSASRKGIDAECAGNSALAGRKVSRSDGETTLAAGSYAHGRAGAARAIGRFPARRRALAGWSGNTGRERIGVIALTAT